MEWYKTLDIQKKINTKDCFLLLFGFDFGVLSFMFSFKERIEMIYDKLKIEGFAV